MKLSIEPGVIRDIASFSMGAVNVRPTSPIMAGLLMEATEAKVTITGDDYTARSTAHGPAEVQELGTALVNGKLFTSIIEKLKAKKPIAISVEGRLMQVSQGAKVFSIPTMDPAEYPAYKADLRELGSIGGEAFAHAVKSVAPAASKTTTDIFAGVSMVLGSEFILQATDRYRIAEASLEWDSHADEIAIVAPASWLLGATKYAGGEVVFSVEENNGAPSRLAISCGEYMTVSGLLEGNFPKIRALTELHKNHWPAVFNRNELQEAIDSVAMMAEAQTPVRVALKDGVATIDAGSSEGGVGIAQISVQHAEEATLGFMPRFILDGLKVHDTETVTMNIDNPAKPVVITGTENLKYTAMPVRLTAANSN